MTISSFVRISFVLMLTSVSLAADDDEGYTTDGLDHVKSQIKAKKAVLIDVRERGEWNQGHLKDAVLVPLSALQVWERDGIPDDERAKLAKAIPKDAVIYCHCAAGARALPAGELLRKLGYDAHSLKPGYRALLKAGFLRAAAK